jgi:hypothetical protein
VTEPSEDEDREPEALGPKMVAEGSPSSQETESELPVSTEVARHRSEAAQVEVSAVVASSHPLSVYGGIQVDETVLYDLAEAIRSGSFPMLIVMTSVGRSIRQSWILKCGRDQTVTKRSGSSLQWTPSHGRSSRMK